MFLQFGAFIVVLPFSVAGAGDESSASLPADVVSVTKEMKIECPIDPTKSFLLGLGSSYTDPQHLLKWDCERKKTQMDEAIAYLVVRGGDYFRRLNQGYNHEFSGIETLPPTNNALEFLLPNNGTYPTHWEVNDGFKNEAKKAEYLVCGIQTVENGEKVGVCLVDGTITISTASQDSNAK